jgi:hypothetical protein
MTSALMLVALIVLFGLLFVVVPVIFDAYNRYREGKLITCPETRDPAEVALKTRQAAFGAAFGKPSLLVGRCSLWPKKQGCGEKCVKENWPAPY